jgi:hypothetical protein
MQPWAYGSLGKRRPGAARHENLPLAQVEFGFGFPPPDVGVAGFKFGFGGLTNFGLLPDDVLEEQPIALIGVIRRTNKSKKRIAIDLGVKESPGLPRPPRRSHNNRR